MSLFQEIKSIGDDLHARELLRLVIEDKCPGRVAVTASLRAPSLVVLKMIADIDPAMPVIFCQPGVLLKESAAYRERIVKLLGLTNISVSHGSAAPPLPGDADHGERMWVECELGHGRIFEVLHLNEELAGYDCWISAVYHQPRSTQIRHKVDIDGRLILIDPLADWSKDDIRRFMRANRIPYHPRAVRPVPAPVTGVQAPAPTYHF